MKERGQELKSSARRGSRKAEVDTEKPTCSARSPR